jgi:prepilin-type N-terminal cleavage/methylation domain-containing protein
VRSHHTEMRRRGFTLIEMTVVITVLAVMAALVLPNMVAIQRSRELRLLKASIQRLPQEAKQEARKSNAPVVLRVDGDDLVMERIPVGDEAGNDPVEIRRVALNDAIRVERARQGEETIDLASWEWRVYPDGSCPSANLEFTEGDISEALIIEAAGDAHWATGDEADMEQQWAAGDIETRG